MGLDMGTKQSGGSQRPPRTDCAGNSSDPPPQLDKDMKELQSHR